MKIRPFTLAILSVAGLALSTNYASAWELFSCFHHHCECRPYNAFTPAPPCCNPKCSLHHGHHSHKACCCCCQAPVSGNFPMCCAPTGDMGCMNSSMPVYTGPSTPVQSLPSPGSNTFTPPPPTPNPVFNQTSMPYGAMMPYNAQPANFQPMPYPMPYPAYPMNGYPMNSYPTNNYPMPMNSMPAYPMMPPSAPNYWYNNQ